MSINEVRYLPECGSTNAYVKEHFEELKKGLMQKLLTEEIRIKI